MKHKFSVTKNYVSNWTEIEAIREVLQNAYDSYGEEVISFDDNVVSIKNKGVKLHVKTLLMGFGTKTHDSTKVGGFSEGSLLSILVLARNGYNVTIINSDEVWKPIFEYDEDIDEEILCIEVSKSDNTNNDFEYIIEGLSNNIIERLKNEFLGLDGKGYSKIDTEYGEILTDEKYSGKMFVNSLPIMSDSGFKYGYNFNSNIVSLDRDRKSINLRELFQICSKTIISVKDDFEFINKAIESTNNDADYIRNESIDLNNDFVDNYCKYLSNKLDIKDNSVVVNKENERVIKEIEKRKKNGEDIDIVVTNKPIQANIVNRKNVFSSKYLHNINLDINTKSRRERALNDFEGSDLESLLKWYGKYSKHLPNNAKEELYNDVMINLESYNFDEIQEEVYKRYDIKYE